MANVLNEEKKQQVLALENNCNIWLKMLDTRITAVVALPTIHVSQRKP
ncbi:MAG: hypothetical protein WCB56_17890 [Terriglobales bacterium]|jgi:hypothetical protein